MKLETRVGFEPTIQVLQTRALTSLATPSYLATIHDL